MSERDYFSLRYTIPGFVLLLVVIGFNFHPMFLIFTRYGITDVASLAISVLTLFATSAIGFLISQIWFAYFHNKRTFARILEKEDLEKYMAAAYNWKELKDKKKSDDRRDAVMGAFIDYILNSVIKNDKLYTFFQRKIDLYHTMTSTLVSLSLGLVLGKLFRLSAIFSSRAYCFASNLDSFIYYFTFFVTLFFIILLFYLRQKIFVEYHPMLKIILNNLKNSLTWKKEDFFDVFPEYLTPKNSDKQDTKISQEQDQQ